MNERIRKLANKSRRWAHFEGFNQNPKSSPEILFEEKFAELIVKKFDDILLLEHLDCVGNKDRKVAERVQRLREKVKTYFGVE